MLVSKVALDGANNIAPNEHLFAALDHHTVVEAKIPAGNDLFKVLVGINFATFTNTEWITGSVVPKELKGLQRHSGLEHAKITQKLQHMGFVGIVANEGMKVLYLSTKDLEFAAAEELIDSVRELVEMVPAG